MSPPDHPTTSARPVVFFSYSHDSQSHRDEVLAWSEKMRANGVETILDQYVNGTPTETWPRWMLNGLDAATHVVCICTQTYYRRFRGQEMPEAGQGVDWEGALITQAIYDARNTISKFIPVIFSLADKLHIPEPLRGRNCYCMPTDFEALRDAIFGQAGIEPGPLGVLKRKTRAKAGNREAINPDIADAEAATVFAKLVSVIDDVLHSVPNAANFVGPLSKNLLIQRDDHWIVRSGFRRGLCDIGPILRAIAERLRFFGGVRYELEAVEQIVGGIFLLGLDPRWIHDQRLQHRLGPIEHPKYGAVVEFGGGNKASFLAILATALSSGIARLERVFGPFDPRRVPPLPRVLPGFGQDRIEEIQRHFIRFVLGPSDEVDVDALTGAELNTFVSRTRQRLKSAMDGDPFYLAAEDKRLAIDLRRELQTSDFYLFVPADSGDESLLMTDPIIALEQLHVIHTIIKQRPSI